MRLEGFSVEDTHFPATSRKGKH
ncbi:hypothetical protein [Pectobacterium brasiliense]|nr:hypothetical protein [Pectobacterium brasiliense]